MKRSVPDAVRALESQGLIKRKKGEPQVVIKHVREVLQRALPTELEELYAEGVSEVAEFDAVLPALNGRMGWHQHADDVLRSLLHVDAVPIFNDGCGNLFGLDLNPASKTRAVYFFDHERLFDRPVYAAGSSLGRFLLLLSQEDRAVAENWDADWQLSLDPEIDKCPRAPPLWIADRVFR